MTVAPDVAGPPLTVEVNEGIAWLTFARPAAANAINLETARLFRDAVRDLVADADCRVVVLAGDRRFFCAGGDVSEMLAAADAGAYLLELASTMHDGIEQLSSSRLLVLAAVEGVAAGAGFSVVLNADVVVAAPAASFLVAYTEVGLTPDSGLSALLPRAVGEHRAKELILLGRRLDAQTALDWGIVAEVVDEQLFAERVRQLARRLADAPQPAAAEALRLLSSGRSAPFAEHLAEEAETISRMVTTATAQERLRSFARKNSTERSTR